MAAGPRRGRGPLLSLVTVGALAALGAAAEGGFRRARPAACARFAPERTYLERDRALLGPCFRRQTVRGVPSLAWARGATEPGAPLTVPLHKAAGVLRVAVIGESSGSLLAAGLQRRVGEAACGRVEVLNCAQHSAALEHVERNLDEVLGYGPDAVVLVFGHNLRFRFPTDERRIVARQWLNRSCLLSSLAPRAEPAMAVVPLDGRLRDLERFLGRLTAETRRRGARLVLTTMAANLWFPPGDGDLLAGPLLDARFADAADGPGAAARLLASVPGHERSAYESFRAGEALARAGEEEPARQSLQRAVDDDRGGGRAHSRTNDLLRRVAGAAAVPLRDTERALARETAGGLPGWESFVDTCHLRPDRVDREARAILELLGRPDDGRCAAPPAPDRGLGAVLDGAFRYGAGGAGPSPWDDAAALAVEQWFRRDPAEAGRALAAFVAGLPDRADARRAAQMLCALAEGCFRAGRVDLARDFNERARLADERAPGPWNQRGLFALRGGDRAAARAAWERALALAPADREARRLLDRLGAGP